MATPASTAAEKAPAKPAAASPAKPAAPAKSVKRAVLAGINYITEPFAPDGSRLSGCVNDVKSVRDLLIKRFQFEPANIQLLIDEGNDGKLKQPTARNIIVALRLAMKASKPGDVLYFHFSGHGSYQADSGADEVDKQDEFIVASDFEPLTDDFLRGQIASLQDGVKFIFVCDACHSGSMLDQPISDIQLTGDKGPAAAATKSAASKDLDKQCPPNRIPRQIPPAAYIKVISSHFKTPVDYLASLPYLPPERLPAAGTNLTWKQAVDIALNAMKEVNSKGAVVKNPKILTIKNKYVVLLSGCEDKQTSADASFLEGKDYKSYGALTYCFLNTINSKKGPISYLDVAKGVRNRLFAYGFEQNPVLTCAKDLDAKAFIDG